MFKYIRTLLKLRFSHPICKHKILDAFIVWITRLSLYFAHWNTEFISAFVYIQFFIYLVAQGVTAMKRKGWYRSGLLWWTRRTLWFAGRTTWNCCKCSRSLLSRRKHPLFLIALILICRQEEQDLERRFELLTRELRVMMAIEGQ